ncbi:MAG TPA: 16S rRNA (cytidine(1402)-2'-O)-methyltransferase [Gammaproteobacteria bacterium]|nr:16S rRNA (cytidine(1402)-2'-O)-methyltransferase [Gammaproteobacteria bacterium]
MKTGKAERPGKLYVVATPIGNLSDITNRALETLAAVELIAAEDTRHSRTLLQHYGIKTAMLSLHEHNESSRIKQIIGLLQAGSSVALISDAGTPLISDPGSRLVQAVHEAGLQPVPMPGPSAVSTMLSVAGQPVERFCFEGFLPSKAAARRKQLGSLLTETRTLVFYESSHRISDSIQDMKNAFGASRPCTVGRELTKRFESLYRGTLAEVLLAMQQDENSGRGEFVIVVAGAEENPDKSIEAGQSMMDVLLTELSVSQAASLAARMSGARKKVLYEYGLGKKGE